MELKPQDIIFAALLGSKIIKTSNNLNLVQNELQKHVLPSFPVRVDNNHTGVPSVGFPSIGNLNTADAVLSEDQQFFPLSLSVDEGDNFFLLPYEPLLTINGKNTIIRRNTAKWRPDQNANEQSGSIKERWNQDDYDLTITGVLMGSILTGKSEDCFPRKDFQKLKEFLTNPGSIKILCEPLQLLDINYMVIETMSFPFTKGENVQAYEIKGYSDSGKQNTLKKLLQDV